MIVLSLPLPHMLSVVTRKVGVTYIPALHIQIILHIDFIEPDNINI